MRKKVFLSFDCDTIVKRNREKDADVVSHTMNDPSKPVKEKEQARYDSICREFGLS